MEPYVNDLDRLERQLREFPEKERLALAKLEVNRVTAIEAIDAEKDRLVKSDIGRLHARNCRLLGPEYLERSKNIARFRELEELENQVLENRARRQRTLERHQNLIEPTRERLERERLELQEEIRRLRQLELEETFDTASEGGIEESEESESGEDTFIERPQFAQFGLENPEIEEIDEIEIPEVGILEEEEEEEELEIIPAYLFEERRMANLGRLNDIPKFTGTNKGVDDPETHLLEFGDAISNFEGVVYPPQNQNQATLVIRLFIHSIRGRARQWFQNAYPNADQRQTVAHWNAIVEEFKRKFNICGDTDEERMYAWKNMKWDGKTDVDMFMNKYRKLGTQLGLNEAQILMNFKCENPKYYLLLQQAGTLNEALEALKRATAMQDLFKGKSDSDTDISKTLPFMMGQDVDEDDYDDELLAMTDKRGKNNVRKTKNKDFQILESRVGKLENKIGDQLDSINSAIDNLAQDQNRFQGNQGNRPNFRQNQNYRGPPTQLPNFLRKLVSTQQRQGNQDRTTCAWCQFNNHSLSTCWKFGRDVERMTGLKLIKPNGRYLTGGFNGFNSGRQQVQRNQRLGANSNINPNRNRRTKQKPPDRLNAMPEEDEYMMALVSELCEYNDFTYEDSDCLYEMTETDNEESYDQLNN